MNLKIFRCSHLSIWAVVFIFLFKVVYIFQFTAYATGVRHDMASYFYGACNLIWGDTDRLWRCFPPCYMYLLSFIIRIADSLNLLSYVLDVVVVLNVLLHCIASYVVYLIVYRLTGAKWISLGALLFYGFSYTAMILNALLLPDNWATPLLVLAVGVLVLSSLNKLNLVWLGLLLGLMVALKPFFVVFIPVFFGAVVLKMKDNRVVSLSLLLFFFLIVPIMTIAGNYYVSKGHLKGLGANGGVNFFQGWSQYGRVETINSGVYSPGASDQAKWPPFVTKIPFYQQDYFYHLGFEAIKNNPEVLVKKISWFKSIFFGGLGPNLKDKPVKYAQIMMIFQYVIYIMFLSVGITYIFYKNSSDAGLVAFLYVILITFFVSIYLLGLPERRYLSYIEFLITILSFTAIQKIRTLFDSYRKEILIYSFCMACFFVSAPIVLNILIKLEML